MAYTNNNQNNKSKSVNTQGYQFYNDDDGAMFKSTLAVGYYDRYLSLRIHPALPEEKRTNTSRYDYETQLLTALTPDKALALVTAVNEKIYPAMSAGKTKSVGVPVGADGIVNISYLAEEGIVCLGLYKGLDPETKKPKESMVFQFKPTMVVEGYDPEKGNFVTENTESDFVIFITILEQFVKKSGMMDLHVMRYGDRFLRDRLYTLTGSGNNNSGYTKNYNNNGGVFGNGGSSSKSNNNPPVENMNYGDAIDQFME